MLLTLEKEKWITGWDFNMDSKDIFSLVEKNGAWSISDFQARYFVVNSQVTNYRRVRQAMLEIETRIAARKQIERNVKRTEIQKKMALRDYEAQDDSLAKELILVDIEQFDYDLSVYEKKYKICLEELEQFAAIIKDVVPNMEDLRGYENHNEEEERRYWLARMAKQAAMDLITIGRIGQGNLDSIAMMPLADQKETIKAALTYNSLLNKGIHTLEKQVQEELSTLPSNINYIDEIIYNQLTLKAQRNELQSTVKPETI